MALRRSRSSDRDGILGFSGNPQRVQLMNVDCKWRWMKVASEPEERFSCGCQKIMAPRGVSLEDCGRCPHRNSEARRVPLLGDAVAKVIQTVGIKPCGGCDKRKETLNRADKAVRKVAQNVMSTIKGAGP